MKQLTGETIIAEITLVREDGRGWIAELNNGETAWVIGDTRELCDSVQGDVIIASLERHQQHPAPHWYAAWSVTKGNTSLASVDAARRILERDGPQTSGEIGPSEGDLLFHAGEAAKFVMHHRRKSLVADCDIWYALDYENAFVGED